jgi:PAS domain S-box-containing protein
MAEKPTYDELESRIKTLEEDVRKHNLEQKDWHKSEKKYKTLIENANSIILRWDPNGKIIYLNPYGLDYFKYKEDEIVGAHTVGTIVPEEETSGRNLREMIKNITKNPERYKNNLNQNVRSDGERVWVQWTNVAIIDEMGNFAEILSIGNDITEKVLAEEMLRSRERQLKAQTQHLEEVNTAMKILLKKREEDKNELEEKVLLNVRELVANYLEKLKHSGLNGKQKTYVDIIDSNLNDIISPFLKRLSHHYSGLTPTEVGVAKLIKQGKTSKEIAELFNLSPRTIEFHRDNIREKMGLKNRKINLRTHLLSIN